MAIGPDGDEIFSAEVQDSDEFMPLPTSFEIDEWSMMEEFAQQRPQPLRDELLNGLKWARRLSHLPRHRQASPA